MRIEIIKTDKGQIEYSITGEGTPVLFIHGGHSNCQETLSHKGFDTSKYRLITPSRPGYGNTPLDDITTPRKTADLFVSLLNHLGIEKVVLYGISAGGLSAIELAANYPERVDKLILTSAVTKKWLDKNDQIYKMANVMFNPVTGKIVWGLIIFFSGIIPKIIAKSFYSQFSKNKPHRLKKNDIKELVSALKSYNSKHGFTCDIDHDIESSVILKIHCPTLIIHSKNDNSVSYEHAEHAKESIKNSQLAGLDNEWGHLIWIGDDSKEPIRKIIEFIEK